MILISQCLMPGLLGLLKRAGMPMETHIALDLVCCGADVEIRRLTRKLDTIDIRNYPFHMCDHACASVYIYYTINDRLLNHCLYYIYIYAFRVFAMSRR